MVPDRPLILDESAADESYLVGTREQLESFARSILHALATPVPPEDWHGVSVRWPHPDEALTDPLGYAVLRGVAVVESETDRRVLVNAVRLNCGDVAIDWEGRDALRARAT